MRYRWLSTRRTHRGGSPSTTRPAADLVGYPPELDSDQWYARWRLRWPDGSAMSHDQCPMAVALKEGRPLRGVEAVAERPDGKLVAFLAYLTPLRDERGMLVGAVNTLVDIGDKRRTELELRRLNETLEQRVEERTSQLVAAQAQAKTFFDHSSECHAVMLAAPDGRFLYEDVNPATLSLYGRSRDEVIGFSTVDVLGAERAQEVDRHLAQCLRTGGPYRYARTQHGATVEAVAAIVPDEDGRPRRLVVTAHDVTDARRLEQQLRQVQKIEAIGQLSSGIAHDFNNLLTAVIGNLDLIEASTANEQVRRWASSAMRAAKRGAKLTHQLLAFSRKQRLEPKPTSINELASGLAEMLRGTLGGTIRVELALRDGLWPALVDQNQIENAILNLAINARDAMPEGGTLTLETLNRRVDASNPVAGLEPGDYVVVVVTDTGVGMSEEVKAKAFDPFFTTKDVGKGSGLGLSQVYGIAQQSGGGVGIDSIVGLGTAVRIYLPRSRGASDDEADERRGFPHPGSFRSERVLVVDDDDDVRQIIATLLRARGYRVETVVSGDAALAALREGPFDLAILDLAMPDMNGIDAARIVRSRWPDLPILFITGHADAARLHGDFAEDAVLQKPFLSADLEAKLRSLLQRRTGSHSATVVKLRPESG